MKNNTICHIVIGMFLLTAMGAAEAQTGFDRIIRVQMVNHTGETIIVGRDFLHGRAIEEYGKMEKGDVQWFRLNGDIVGDLSFTVLGEQSTANLHFDNNTITVEKFSDQSKPLKIYLWGNACSDLACDLGSVDEKNIIVQGLITLEK